MMQFLIRKPREALAAMNASKRQRNRPIGAPQGLENLAQVLPWAKLSWPFGPGIHGAFNIDPSIETE